MLLYLLGFRDHTIAPTLPVVLWPVEMAVLRTAIRTTLIPGTVSTFET